MLDISSQFILWMLGVRSFEPQWNFTSIYIKKNHRFFLKTKKVRDMFRKFGDRQIFVFFAENFHWILYENEKIWDRTFSKFSISKISNFFIEKWMKMKNFEIENFDFFDLKNFRRFPKHVSNFFRFQKNRWFFYRSM